MRKFQNTLGFYLSFIIVNTSNAEMMLISKHLNREVAGDDAIIVVARVLKSDFLTRKLAALSALFFTVR